MKLAARRVALALSWVALIALLGLTVTLAYQPLGMFNGPIALSIATVKALIVAAIFMELRERRPLTLAFAGAGVILARHSSLARVDGLHAASRLSADARRTPGRCGGAEGELIADLSHRR